MVLTNSTAIEVRKWVFWVGGDDRRSDLFEGTIPIPSGISYNSYLLSDRCTCLIDCCDSSVSTTFWRNLKDALGGRGLDYLVLTSVTQNIGIALTQVLDWYPEVTVVGNGATFEMLEKFHVTPANTMLVKDGDVLDLGEHSIEFITAGMLRWPDTMLVYEPGERMLFSSDLFGSFGVLSGTLYSDEIDFDREYLDESRRYYSATIGRFGQEVQEAFGKIAGLQMDFICPAHGPLWRGETIGYIFSKYDAWSRFEAEDEGVVIAFASMCGNTAEAASRLTAMLRERNVENIKVYDTARTHPSYIVSDLYRLTNIVLASPTYNGGLHPAMSALLDAISNSRIENRSYSVIGNGSWDPRSQKIIEDRMNTVPDIMKVGSTFVIESSISVRQNPDLERLADDIASSVGAGL